MDELQIVYTTEAMQDILGISDYYFDKALLCARLTPCRITLTN